MSKENFCTFDIEAADWTKFRVLGFFDGKNFLTFRSISSFLDFVLTRKYRSKRLYAHYGGKYDFLFLLDELFKRTAYTVEIMEAGSRIIEIKVSRGKDIWKFCDSYALLPCSLKDLTYGFDVKHKKEAFDVEKEKDFTSPEALAYLENDCKGLFEVVQYFASWGSNDGITKSTLASQALYVFRHDFLDRRLLRLNDDAEHFIRRCYYGGRTEIYKVACGAAFYYDVNSMYPWAMLQDMPTGRAVRVNRFKADGIGFYRCRVSVPYRSIPCIPCVRAHKLIFPCGDFETYLPSAEVKQAMEDGYRIEILEGYVFTDKAPIFREYVNYFYELKKKAKKGSAEYIIAKLNLNSLYGKFGQRRNRETIIRVSDFDDIVKHHLTPYFEELALYKKASVSRSQFILPHLSAYITSLARVRLHRIIQQAGEENAIYCDTDSLITTTKLPTGDGLGELKLEYEIDEGIFLQPKVYMIRKGDECHIKIKGFSSHTCTAADFRKALKEKDVTGIRSQIARITGYKENLRRFKSAEIRRIVQDKGLNQEYNKRIIKGILTEPLILEE